MTMTMTIKEIRKLKWERSLVTDFAGYETDTRQYALNGIDPSNTVTKHSLVIYSAKKPAYPHQNKSEWRIAHTIDLSCGIEGETGQVIEGIRLPLKQVKEKAIKLLEEAILQGNDFYV